MEVPRLDTPRDPNPGEPALTSTVRKARPELPALATLKGIAPALVGPERLSSFTQASARLRPRLWLYGQDDPSCDPYLTQPPALHLHPQRTLRVRGPASAWPGASAVARRGLPTSLRRVRGISGPTWNPSWDAIAFRRRGVRPCSTPLQGGRVAFSARGFSR